MCVRERERERAREQEREQYVWFVYMWLCERETDVLENVLGENRECPDSRGTGGRADGMDDPCHQS